MPSIHTNHSIHTYTDDTLLKSFIHCVSSHLSHSLQNAGSQVPIQKQTIKVILTLVLFAFGRVFLDTFRYLSLLLYLCTLFCCFDCDYICFHFSHINPIVCRCIKSKPKLLAPSSVRLAIACRSQSNHLMETPVRSLFFI